jgi:hypothetical protein
LSSFPFSFIVEFRLFKQAELLFQRERLVMARW